MVGSGTRYRMPAVPALAARIQVRLTGVLPVLPLILMVASDYKVRIRSDSQAVGGSADPLVLLELAVYLVVGVTLFVAFPATRPGRLVSPPALAAGLWFGYLLLSAVYSPYPSFAGARAVEFLVWVMLALAMARLAGRAGLHRFAHGFVVLVAGSVVLGRFDPFPSLPLQTGRFTWLYVHPVVAGIYLGLATVVCLVYLFGHAIPRPGPHWAREVYLLLFLLLAYGLYATRTRGAGLAAFAAILLVMFMLVRLHRRRDLLVFSVLGCAGVSLAFSSTVIGFLTRGESTAQLATLNSRTQLWSLAWQQTQLEPFFGHGMSASRGLFLDSIGLGGGHNAIVNIMVDQGFVGVFFFLLLLATLALALRTLARIPALRLDVALLAGVLAYLVGDGLTTEYMGAPDDVASGWLLIVVVWVYTLHAVVLGRLDTRAADDGPGRGDTDGPDDRDDGGGEAASTPGSGRRPGRLEGSRPAPLPGPLPGQRDGSPVPAPTSEPAEPDVQPVGRARGPQDR